MRLGKYKINSSVIIASAIAFISGLFNLVSDGLIIDNITDIIAYILNDPEQFKPFIADKVYQFLLTFLPLLIIILRNTNVRRLPPIEEIN